MRSRPLAAILLTLAFSAAACQFVWSYDSFKDQPGTGGSITSVGATSSSGGGGASSSGGGSSSSTSASSTSSSSGDAGCAKGGPPGMACTDCCDKMVIAARQGSIQGDIYGCTVPNLGNQSGAQACIVQTDGLSMACAGCWAAEGQCGYQKCWPQCGIAVNSAPCNACLVANCDPTFTACSGISRPAAMDGGVDAPCN